MQKSPGIATVTNSVVCGWVAPSGFPINAVCYYYFYCTKITKFYAFCKSYCTAVSCTVLYLTHLLRTAQYCTLFVQYLLGVRRRFPRPRIPGVLALSHCVHDYGTIKMLT
jgi:hypothetical protein